MGTSSMEKKPKKKIYWKIENRNAKEKKKNNFFFGKTIKDEKNNKKNEKNIQYEKDLKKEKCE